MLFVGIDPSTTRTGIVVLEDANPVPLFHTSLKGGDERGLQRVRTMGQELIDTLSGQAGGAEIRLGIEGYAYGNAFSLATLVELGTVYRMMIIDRGWPFVEPSPGQVKKFAGIKTGKLTAQVQALWGWKPPNHDVADAYVIAQIARAAYSRVVLTPAQMDVVHACRHGLSDTSKAA